MQLLVLARKTLVPDNRVGSFGQACLINASGVASFSELYLRAIL
jgi:hypothetical protein